MMPIPANIPVESVAPIKSKPVIHEVTGIMPNNIDVTSTGIPDMYP